MPSTDFSQFIAAFFDEARQRLGSINQALVAFEAESLDEKGLTGLRRDAHTIKGSALMLGVADVGEAGHLFEDAVEHLIKNAALRTPAMVQFLFDMHDRLAERLQAVDSKPVETADLKQRYESLLESDGKAESPAPAVTEAGPADTPSETQSQDIRASSEVVAGSARDDGQWGDFKQFIAAFFDEARGRLGSIDKALVALESGSLDADGLAALKRDAHTIKGSALMLGVADVGAAGHLFEDAVERMTGYAEIRTPEMARLLMDIHDRLAVRLQAVDAPDIEVKDFQLRFDALLSAGDAAKPTGVKETGAEIGSVDKATSGHQDATEDEQSGQDEQPAPVVADTPESAANSYRPDVSEVKAKVGGQATSGRFLRVDAERLNVLSGQLFELSTGKAFGTQLNQDVQSLLKQLGQLQSIARKVKAELPAGSPSESLTMFDRQMDWLSRATRHLASDVEYNVGRQGIMLDVLRDQVLGLMLRPLDTVFSAFPRAVRDVAGRHNRKARLVTAGESVQCDQSVVESLMEPLVHLINNAVVHGIESPEERRALGKPEAGQLSLIAVQSGSEIHIEVIDDGRGIDPQHIKQVAVERGVTTQYEADAMSDAEALEMIFRPGFSTHLEVDQTSGRGIGMNVVQDTVRRLTGVIRIHTEKGRGTRFLISLPVSIAVQRALMFRIGEQKFGMLIHMVEQVVAPKASELLIEEGRPIVRYGNHTVPLVDLRRMFSGDKDAAPGEVQLVLIARHIDGFTGIVVDQLFEEAEIIVRELDPYLKRYQAQGLMGNTIGDDGQVVLLMEPYGIKEMGRTAPMQVVHDLQPGAAGMQAVRALLVEDSIIARQIERSLLESLGMVVDTAIDGLDAVDKLERSEYDVLVTDLEMPRLDGFGLVRRIRNDPRFAGMPILIISTRESAEDRMKGLDAGADAYLIKQNLAQGGLHETLLALLGPLTAGDESRTMPPSHDAPIV